MRVRINLVGTFTSPSSIPPPMDCSHPPPPTPHPSFGCKSGVTTKPCSSPSHSF